MFEPGSKVCENAAFEDTRASWYVESRQAIERNIVSFQDLVALADSFLSQGRYGAAAVYAQIAADYAWHNHPGVFVSSQLERILHRIGHDTTRLAHCARRNSRPNRLPGHVFHVLTQAYGIGGHTRLVWRWIQQDTERSHSIVLTRQGSWKVPRILYDAARAAGGRIYSLDARTGDLLFRARALRKLVGSADQVVLHIHPYDVVPTIAFASKQNLPPVIFLNHSDHVFWVGASISDAVAQLRESGRLFSRERRGIPLERSILFPTPLGSMRRTLSRSQAKSQLGFPEDRVLILSAASSYKYAPLFEYSFTDTIMPILEKYDNTVLLVIGPGNTRLGQFITASHQMQGSVKVLDKREDTSLFYQAADIYVDSFPFPSITSLLEAGAYALPLVSYCPYPSEAEMFCADAPGLSNNLIRATSAEQYIAVLSRLIENSNFRLVLGESAKQSISDKHGGKDWHQFLRNLYLRAAEISSAPEPQSELNLKPAGTLDILLAGLHSKGRISRPLDAVIRDHIRLLPLGLRARVWAETCRRDEPLKPSLLLPEWLCTRLGKLRSWRKR